MQQHQGGPWRLTRAELCTFFHRVTECPEACLKGSCVCGRACERKSVCCVARYGATDGAACVRMYQNVRSNGETVHAESFLVRDDALRDAVRERPGGTLTLWMTFQPCHRSGGRTRHGCKKSCTELLERFHRGTLAPHGVSLVVATANVYRAHWRRQEEWDVYHVQIRNAEAGIVRLARFATVRAFAPDDWAVVEALCDGAAGCVTEEHRAARKAMDEYNHQYLAGLCAPPVGPCSECECDVFEEAQLLEP